ncbi:hypothetical protein Dimus_007829 [Dionaea muscipula]
MARDHWQTVIIFSSELLLWTTSTSSGEQLQAAPSSSSRGCFLPRELRLARLVKHVADEYAIDEWSAGSSSHVASPMACSEEFHRTAKDPTDEIVASGEEVNVVKIAQDVVVADEESRFARGLGYLFQILRWFYDGGLAPPALPRRRISFTEECQIALRAVPVSFGRPGESRRLRAVDLEMRWRWRGRHRCVFRFDLSPTLRAVWLHRDGFAGGHGSMEVMLPPVESGGSDDEVVRSVERRSTAPPMEFSRPLLTSLDSVSSSGKEESPSIVEMIV